MTSALPRRRQIIQDHKALKRDLDSWYRKINIRGFIPNDPVQFPHRYSEAGDIEIASFLATTIAWGRRDLIIRSCERMFSLMKPGPYAYVMSGDFKKLGDKCVHRTFFEHDLKYFCQGFKKCYERYGNLQELFASAADIWEGIALFRQTMAEGNRGRYIKHLANPDSSSACKRLNLALRWLVRREGPVDLGLWKKISPSSLYIPLDLHVGRTARLFGLLDPSRKANYKKAVIALTGRLKEICPDDPVKYDFSLFGMGIEMANNS